MRVIERLKKIREFEKQISEDSIIILDGIIVLGFRLKVVKSSGRGYVHAYKYINGKKCHLNLGRVYGLKEAEDKIREKMKYKIEKDNSFIEFIANKR